MAMFVVLRHSVTVLVIVLTNPNNLTNYLHILKIYRDLQIINNACAKLLTEIKTMKAVKKITYIGRANIKKKRVRG